MSRFSNLFALIVPVVALVFLPGIATAQNECSARGFDSAVQYQSGGGLSVCETQMKQCCNEAYIRMVNNSAVESVREELRMRLLEVADRIREITNPIFLYFNRSLVADWVNSLAIPNPLDILSGGQLTEVYDRVFLGVNFASGFNSTALISNIQNHTIGTAATIIVGARSNVSRTCVETYLQGRVSAAGKAFLNTTFTRLHQGLSVLHKVGQFFYDLNRFGNLELPEGCIRQFVEKNFCERCTRSTPPLCSNTCRALLIGCLSPYHNVLSGEVNVFVNVASQTVREISDGLQSLFNGTGTAQPLFDTNASSSLNDTCNVTHQPAEITPNGFISNFNTSERLTEIKNLTTTGPFNYSAACRPSEMEQQFCSSTAEDQRQSNCSLTVACTSDCNCFNGVEEQPMNTVEFSGGDIGAQVNNTAIDIPCSELNRTASSLGTPLWDFLHRLKMQGAFPSGVDLPPMPNLDVVQCGGGGNGGSKTASMSWTRLCLVVLLAKFCTSIANY